MTQLHATAAEETVARALKEGATEAEAYVCSMSVVSIDRMGSLVYARESRETGVALRLTSGKRAGSASMTGALDKAIPKVVAEAMRRMRAKPEAGRLPTLADPQPLGSPTRVDPRLVEVDADGLTADVNAITSVMEKGADLTFHATSLANYGHEFGVANSRGVSAWDADAIQILNVDGRVTRSGVARTARETAYAHKPVRESLDVEALARTVLERATLATTPEPLPGPVDEVLFAPVPAGEMLYLWAPSLAGAASGPFAHPKARAVGERVASDAITIRDEPRGAHGPRHQRMDDEGTPTSDRALVERGELRARLYNATSAANAGASPTGNAFRGLVNRWSGGTTTAPGNLHLREGSRSVDEIIASMDRGVVVTDQLKGTHAANRTTGDFSLVAPLALYVERGEVKHALPTLTLGGNVHELLQNVVEVARAPRSSYFGHIPPFRARGVALAT